MSTAKEAALRISIEHLLEGVQVVGFDWTYLYVNETAARQSRRPASELIGQTVMSCYPGIEGTELFAAVERVMRTRQSERLLTEFVLPDSSRGWFELRVEPVPDGVCVLSVDVSDRERMQAQLRESEERKQFALRSARIGVWEFDVQSGEVFWSETLEQLVGLAPGRGPRKMAQFLEYLDPQDRDVFSDTLQRAITRPAEDFSVEFRFVRPDGHRRWMEGHGRFMLDRNGDPERLLGVAIDVTERRTTELQLQHAQKMEAIGRLAGGIAHDFNNVLTAILGYSELALERSQEDAGVVADIGEIRKAGERASRLTRQLLAFSRKQVLLPQVIDVNRLVLDIERMLSRVIGEDIRVELSTAPFVSPTKADPGQIEQVLMNLVVNARDAMPQGGTVRIITANVELGAEFTRRHTGSVPGRYVALAVQDTGCGMDSEVISRVFEPFFTTKGPGKGTGLGLATVYGIVKQSGGYITVESTLGVGTTVTAYLPVVDEAVQQDGPNKAQTGTGTETILLVEDDDGVRDLMRRTLTDCGYTILEARDVVHAAEIAERHTGVIQLLLTDIVMPIMNGPNLAQRVLSHRPAIKVLYVSGFPQNFAHESGAMSSRTMFLAKPFAPAMLATTVRGCLDRYVGAA